MACFFSVVAFVLLAAWVFLDGMQTRWRQVLFAFTLLLIGLTNLQVFVPATRVISKTALGVLAAFAFWLLGLFR